MNVLAVISDRCVDTQFFFRMSKPQHLKFYFSIAIVFLAGYIVITLSDNHIYAVWLLMIFFLAVVIGLRNYEILKGYPFTVMIFTAMSVAMYHNKPFISVGKLSCLGMGTAIEPQRFSSCCENTERSDCRSNVSLFHHASGCESMIGIVFFSVNLRLPMSK